MFKFGKRTDIDMTAGSIFGNLIKFAMPLLLGNLFQQLYNMVDTWVIGQTGQSGAYAAVGSVGPITTVLIGFFIGLSSGSTVVISQYYGAGKYDDVKKAVHTSLAMTVGFAVLFTALGIIMTPTMLKLMLHSDTNSEIYPFAKTYLTVYFSGAISLMVYNMGSGILRAVGDSSRPFIFLVISSITNIILDFVFVFAFNMGVAGVATATVISQTVSAVLTVITLLRSESCVKLFPKELKIDIKMIKKIFAIGIPAGLQMAITSFSNVFVQSYISNAQGSQTGNLGGWTTYTKIDQLIFLPLQAVALSVTTFVGQNLGKGQIKRAKRGTYIGYAIATGCAVFLIIPIIIFAPGLARIFNKDPVVVENAVLLLTHLTPFYLCCAVNQTFSSSLRGAGFSRAPMFIMLFSFVIFRQIYLFIVSNYISNTLLYIGFSYPAGWIMCSILTFSYYKLCNYGSKNLVEN